jgi:hypothetical protein
MAGESWAMREVARQQKSPLESCAKVAFAAPWSIVRIITAATRRQSTPINGRMMSGYPISNHGSPGGPAANVALTYARVSLGQRSDPLEDRMSIIPRIVALGLAAVLGSPIHQHQIDYGTGAPDSQRINQLWLVTYFNEAGLEVVAQAKLANGDKAPLIAADLLRLESMLPAARDLAKANNMKLRLIKFINRVDIEDIVP